MTLRDSVLFLPFASTYDVGLVRRVDQNEFEAVAQFQGLRRSLGCLSCMRSSVCRHLLPLRHPTFLRLITRLPAHPAHHCTVPNPPTTSSFPTALFPCPFLFLCGVSRRLFASPPAEVHRPPSASPGRFAHAPIMGVEPITLQCEPPVGIEPTTVRLRSACSTN